MYNHLLQGDNETNVYIFAVDIDSDLIARAQQLNPFPNSIEYAALNIMDESVKTTLKQKLETFKKTKFDLMLCFSVTMWIHLNNGDDGLQRFLKLVPVITDYLLLEPQHWKCYLSASRRMRRLNCDKFQDLRKLTVTKRVAENIDNYLDNDCEMKRIFKFGVTDWKRNVLLYKYVQIPKVQTAWKWT